MEFVFGVVLAVTAIMCVHVLNCMIQFALLCNRKEMTQEIKWKNFYFIFRVQNFYYYSLLISLIYFGW